MNQDLYVPGLWRCAKCGFHLVQANLNARDGSVTHRDAPGDKCPNDGAPLWRVTWKEQAQELGARLEAEIMQRHAEVKFHRLPHGAGLPLPAYATDGAAGLDLCAAEDAKLTGYVVPIPTGFAVEIPPGYEGQVRPRSGWSSAGLVVANAPGTIDSDYRGEIKVLVRASSISTEPIAIKRGDRIAQLVIAPVARAEIVEAETLSETTRGDGGFGSTGT